MLLTLSNFDNPSNVLTEVTGDMYSLCYADRMFTIVSIIIIPLDPCFSDFFSFFHFDLALWSSRQATSLGPLKRIFIKSLFSLVYCLAFWLNLIKFSTFNGMSPFFFKKQFNCKHFDIFFSHVVWLHQSIKASKLVECLCYKLMSQVETPPLLP